MLLRLQDSPVDVTNFYCADTSPWSMFGQFGVPTKVYYVFKGFRRLLATSNRVSCEGPPQGGSLTLCAGLADDKQTAAVLISNFKSEHAR